MGTQHRSKAALGIGGLVAGFVLAALFFSSSASSSTPAPQSAWRTFDQHANETSLQVARGGFSDTTGVFVFGRNPDVDASSAEDIWVTGGDYTFPTAAETLSIVSDNVADDGDPAGTGAWSIVIRGLDANFDQIQEVVTLDGTTPVITTAAFLRVNAALAVQAGSSGTNVGSITATQTTSALTLFTMAPEIGRTQLAIYTTPRDHTLLVTRVVSSISRTQTGTMAVFAILRDASIPDGAFYTFGESGIHSHGSSWVSVAYPVPTNIGGQVDIKVRAQAGSNNSDVNGGFEGYLIDNR